MSTREQRVEVFQDTMAWIKSDPDLSASVDTAKKNTRVYEADEYPSYDTNQKRKMKITVSPDRSFQAAMRLAEENPGKKIAVMNFASAFNPGGGVVKGSSAQEECLCRTSTLYPLLYRKTLQQNYYGPNRDKDSPRATDTLIYTEGVIICKTDEDLPKRMPKEQWVKVDVITVAAPDLRPKDPQGGHGYPIPVCGNGLTMTDAELFGYHVKRVIHVLTCAAHKKADILVLGAFGCGAFRNDPKVVSKAFRTALEVFPKAFDQVEFAVFCPPSGPTTNFVEFEKELLGSGTIK